MIATHGANRWRADLTLAIVALVWGTTFVVVKDALSGISTMYFLALRFGIATVAMLPLLLTAIRAVGFSKALRATLAGSVAGIFLTLGYVLQTFGLLYTTAGNSGFLTGMYIVLVPLLSAAVYRRWPKAAEVTGVGIAGVGMLLLTFPSLRSNFQMNFGDLLTLGCAIAFAGHLLVLAYYSKHYRTDAVAFGQITCVAILSSLALLIERPHARWSMNLVTALIITGVFATALAFLLQTWGQRHTTATRTAVIFALEPVFAFATAVLFAGEKLTLPALSGGALILGGILLVELRSH